MSLTPHIEMTAALRGSSGIDRTFHISGPEAFRDLAGKLMLAGHSVREESIPGLFRINGGPELTVGQFMQVGTELLSAPASRTP